MPEFKRAIDAKIDEHIADIEREQQERLDKEEVMDYDDQIRLDTLNWVKRNS